MINYVQSTTLGLLLVKIIQILTLPKLQLQIPEDTPLLEIYIMYTPSIMK